MVLCDFKKSHSNVPLLFFHSPSNPLLSFFCNNQLMCGCGSVRCNTMCKRRGVGSVVEWAECKGFEFESEEG